ncbi:erythromycin esterase family protein [Actinomadura alba]|uniref:Erythromycin esterase family protein n=2 Tax=Actinomadura alba TaxID=406431 RepID=A0ABR7LPU9_9ACTN|nr:erythromycin esterase family protein [Actinomadura alba]
MALQLEYNDDLDPLLNRIGDARCVLVGEADHGTHEYYAWRAALTRRLIAERGFSFVGVEGDWPDCRQINRCVTLADGAPDDPREVLDRFRRWPTWMWANAEVVHFCEWLRDHNAALPPDRRAGFYGLDVYSLWESLRAIILYLIEHRPDYVETALEACRCFETYGEDPQAYARGTRLAPEGCSQEVLDLLTRLREEAAPAHTDDPAEVLDLRQNAEVTAGAEEYYRAMVGDGPESWNGRDIHMADTLDRLLAFHGADARAVVWAHNTHVGDARATPMARHGLVNLGQLARERHGRDRVVLVGFAGGHGEVVAAPRWGAPMEVMPVPPPRPDSLEALLDKTELGRALFIFSDQPDAAWLRAERGHRAIGVVYDPYLDHHRNWVPTRLGERYDALCWLHRTTPIRPLHLDAARRGELETFPAGV